jgi:hypothetical protein
VFSRILVLGIVVAVGGSAAAQQRGPEVAPALKQQVQTFEATLRNMIEQAGGKFARKAGEIEPSVMLVFSSDPVISGVVVPDVGPHFDVQVPPLLPSNLMVWQMQNKGRQQNAPPGGIPTTTPARPQAPSDKVTAGSLPAADPMSESPTVNPPFDPTREYSNFVRDALIDAMLDYSTALTLNPGEKLTIVAKETIGFNPNPLYRSTQRQLVLTIKAEDLIALRQGKITREDAKQKILDTRF